MGLSRRHVQLQVIETASDLEKLGQNHSAQVATSDDTDFEWRHLVEELL